MYKSKYVIDKQYMPWTYCIYILMNFYLNGPKKSAQITLLVLKIFIHLIVDYINGDEMLISHYEIILTYNSILTLKLNKPFLEFKSSCIY